MSTFNAFSFTLPAGTLSTANFSSSSNAPTSFANFSSIAVDALLSKSSPKCVTIRGFSLSDLAIIS